MTFFARGADEGAEAGILAETVPPPLTYYHRRHEEIL